VTVRPMFEIEDESTRLRCRDRCPTARDPRPARSSAHRA
jgi:hypothetical protein